MDMVESKKGYPSEVMEEWEQNAVLPNKEEGFAEVVRVSVPLYAGVQEFNRKVCVSQAYSTLLFDLLPTLPKCVLICCLDTCIGCQIIHYIQAGWKGDRDKR